MRDLAKSTFAMAMKYKSHHSFIMKLHTTNAILPCGVSGTGGTSAIGESAFESFNKFKILLPGEFGFVEFNLCHISVFDKVLQIIAVLNIIAHYLDNMKIMKNEIPPN